MSDDIKARLRDGCGCNFPDNTCMAESECRDAFEAADRIEALEAENARLQEALENRPRVFCGCCGNCTGTET